MTRAFHQGSRPAARRRQDLLASTALAALIGCGLFAFTPPAAAQVTGVTGGVVVGGQATIANTAPGHVTVTQATQRGVIDWRTFSIAAGERVDFLQPGVSSVTLNRVTGPDPSVIAGRLTATGQLILVNGAGIVFANGAQINAAGLVASTSNIADPQRFMRDGTLVFDRPSTDPNAGVANAGTITVREGGLVGLAGNTASNSGVINARLGRVTIGGAETFTVDLAGDGLINFQLGNPVSRQPVDAQGNKRPLVSNAGTINADGGTVTLTARAARGVVDNVVNAGGVINARAVRSEGGTVVFGAEDGGTVNVTGTVDVSGTGANQRGGRVVATAAGGRVNVASTARIDASGDSGGGSVNIGGSLRGQGPVANARDTRIATRARISADATRQGDGGTVIVWSDNATVFGGTISARGGPQGGDGGFAEVSGKNYLEYRGTADLTAPLGQNGTLLLDPANLTIQDANPDINGDSMIGDDLTSGTLAAGDFPGADSVITAGAVVAQLALGNVLLEATNTITVAAGADITWSQATSLTLNAGFQIRIDGTIRATNAAAGLRLSLNTGPSGSSSGIFIQSSGVVDVGAGRVDMTAQTIQNGGTFTAAELTFAPASGGTLDSLDFSVAGSTNAIGTVSGTASGGFVSIVNHTTSLVVGGISNGDAPINIATAAGSNGDVTIAGPVSGSSIVIAADRQVVVSADITGTGGITLVADGAVAGVGINHTFGTIGGSTVTLTTTAAAGASIIQGPSANIVSLSLLTVNATGSVDLSGTSNDAVELTGRAGGDFRYVDGNALQINSLTIGDGRYGDIAADQIVITGQVGRTPADAINPNGVIVLRPTTAGTPITVGGVGGLGLTQTDLDFIFAGTLRIGSVGRVAGSVLGGVATAGEAAAGAITIQGVNLVSSTIRTLVLETAASGTAISQTGAVVLGATGFLATSVANESGTVVLDNPSNDIGTIAHGTRASDGTPGTQSGAYTYDHPLDINVGGVATAGTPLVGFRGGITTSDGLITLNAGQNIQIGDAIAVTNATAGLRLSLNAARSGSSGGITILSSVDIGAASAAMTARSISNSGGFSATQLSFGHAISGTLDSVNMSVPGAVNSIGFVTGVANGDVRIINHVANASLTVGDISAGPGTVTVGTLGASSDVTFSGVVQGTAVFGSATRQVIVANNITATAGQVVLFADGVGVGIRQVAGTMSGLGVSLNATAPSGGSIVQEGGNIVAGGINANATGSVDLPSPTNNVGTLGGGADGDFRYVDADSLVINVLVLGIGRYADIAADQMTFQGPVGITSTDGDNPTAVVVLRPATAGTAITLGGAGGLSLLQTDLDRVFAGTLRIGSTGRAAGLVLGGATTTAENAAGAISIAGVDLSTTRVRTLVLETAASATAISQSGALVLGTTGTLATSVANTGGSVVLTDPGNSIGTIVHLTLNDDTSLGTQSGGYTHRSTSDLIVGSVGSTATPLIGSRNGIVTGAGDIGMLVDIGSLTLNQQVNAGAGIVRLQASGSIGQDVAGAVVAAGLLARSIDDSVTLVRAGNNVTSVAGSAAGGFRLITVSGLTVSASGITGDTILPIAGAVGVAANSSGSFPSTLELAVGGGDLTISGPISSPDGLVLLRRTAGASAGSIVLDNTAFGTFTSDPQTADAGTAPRLVVVDLTGSPVFSEPDLFPTLMNSSTPATRATTFQLLDASGLPVGETVDFSNAASTPNAGGGISLTGVRAGSSTLYLFGGSGSQIAGSGTFGLLGVYTPHTNPIRLTGDVRRVDPPTDPRSVATPFTEPFADLQAGAQFVRRTGPAAFNQTFNGCTIAGTTCVPAATAPVFERPPATIDDAEAVVQAAGGGSISFTFSEPNTSQVPAPAALDVSGTIVVNQGNEWLFNADEEERRQRADQGGK